MVQRECHVWTTFDIRRCPVGHVVCDVLIVFITTVLGVIVGVVKEGAQHSPFGVSRQSQSQFFILTHTCPHLQLLVPVPKQHVPLQDLDVADDVGEGVMGIRQASASGVLV